MTQNRPLRASQFPIVVAPGYARVDMHLVGLPVENTGVGRYRAECGRDTGTALLAASLDNVTCRECRLVADPVDDR